MTGVRIPADLDAKLNAWIEAQPEPKPSRSEAIRRLLERALSPLQERETRV
jgi:Arc/MetJ-type ribon-helix-helix transcriptional regulator